MRRRKTDLATEQAIEEAGIFVADLESDRLNRLILGLQHLLGFLETHRMHVVQWRQTGGLAEAPNEGALRQTGQLRLTAAGEAFA